MIPCLRSALEVDRLNDLNANLCVGLGNYGIVAIVREHEELAKPLSWGENLGSEGLDRLQRHFEVRTLANRPGQNWLLRHA